MPGSLPLGRHPSHSSTHACHLCTHGSLHLNSSSPSLPRCLVPEALLPKRHAFLRAAVSTPSRILSHLLSCPSNFPVSHSRF